MSNINPSSYLYKTVCFNEKVEQDDIDFDQGMLARITHVGQEDSESWWADFDFTDFEAHNKKLESPSYYDREGKPKLKWSQTPLYPANKVVRWHMPLSDKGLLFDVIGDNTLDAWIAVTPQLQAQTLPIHLQLNTLILIAKRLGLNLAAQEIEKSAKQQILHA